MRRFTLHLRRSLRPLAMPLLACYLCAVGGIVVAQDEFEMTDQQFDSWVMQGVSSQSTPEKHLQSLLATRLQEIGQACELSADQRDEIELAGLGDIDRLNRRVDIARRRLVGKKYSNDEFNEMWEEISPLSQEFQQGVFKKDSLFAKVIEQVLTGEQIAKYEQAQVDRWRRKYAATVKSFVATLQQSAAMTDAQRQQLTAMFEPVGIPNSNEPYYVQLLPMYQLSQVPEEKLKAIFDEPQFKIIELYRNQGRQYAQFLQQQGVLTNVENAENE